MNKQTWVHYGEPNIDFILQTQITDFKYSQ